MHLSTTPNFKIFDIVKYQDSYQQMLNIVSQAPDTIRTLQDQFWFLQHEPVFTQGIRAHQQTSKPFIHDIPVVNTDRGGLITYHGPGQLTIYALCHLNSKNVRQFVYFLEQVVIASLDYYAINAHRRDAMPGVYVNNDKIASIGLRIKNGMSYHGISLNVDMDLTPFSYIDPCGYQGLKMTQISDFNKTVNMQDVIERAQATVSQLIK